MERPKSLTNILPITAIILFHVVGIIGFSLPMWRDLFIYMVPYHLLLMLMAIFYSYGRTSVRLSIFFLLTYVLGYASEWVGVHKGWFFGNYTYGRTLGLQVSGIPLLIGVNWFLLIFSAGTLVQKTGMRNKALRIICGAVLLVLLDICIEPVAMRFNYWDWANDIIPFKNYLCWFLLSLIMLSLYESFRFKRLNYAAPILLAMQFIFFLALNWM